MAGRPKSPHRDLNLTGRFKVSRNTSLIQIVVTMVIIGVVVRLIRRLARGR